MRKLLAAFLLTLSLAPLAAQAETTACFSDLEDFDLSLQMPICALQEDGVIHGFPDRSFHPNWYVSKGEFAKLVSTPSLQVILADGSSEREKLDEGKIEDVLGLAVKYDLLDLDLDNYHAVERIRRSEAVEYMIQAYQVDYEEKGLLATPFTDLNQQNDFDQKVAYLYYYGVVSGRTENIFGSTLYLTRAEAAKLAYLAKDKLTRVETTNNTSETSEETESSELSTASYKMEIVDIVPYDLMAGEKFTVLFTVKTARREKPVTGLDLTNDLHISVVKGRVDIESVEELGGGLYLIKAKVDEQAAPGPIKIDIVLLKGGPSVRVSTSDFFETEPSTTPLVQVIPSVVGTGNTAIIIATPQDFHGDPVSGLELEAAVIHGSGDIIEQMEESPVGSGVYIGKFLADTIPDETTIAVRITNTATRPETSVNIKIR